MKLNRSNFQKYKKYTERVIQFGEGNFLRCFFDWQLDIINEKTDLDAGIAVIRPIDSDYLPLLNTQDGLYTSIIRGINEENQVVTDYRIISSINREIPIYKSFDEYLKLAHNPNMRFIVSNTTEAGIVFEAEDKYDDTPQKSFPGKLTRLLHERFIYCDGNKEKGFILLPCELIDYNGDKLKEIVFQYANLWNLEEEFKTWLIEANIWCSTLVDRIVTGYPKEEKDSLEKEFGYEDTFMTTGEYFYLFVIQGPKELLEKELKISGLDLNILIVDDLKPYKMRKVGILNGAHTSMVPVSYLYGIETVRESLEDEVIGAFIQDAINEEIIPALDMDKDELNNFADAVINRFKNPYVKHFLMSISLNSMSKYKTRILPQVLSYEKKNGKLPPKLVFALASLIRFYKGERDGEVIKTSDDDHILEMYDNLWNNFDGNYINMAHTILSMEEHWETDLSQINCMTETLAKYIESIDTKGMREAIKEVM
jgi:tagaturonate reductase